MESKDKNRFNLPNHITVMNITAALAIGALSVAAYLMVTEPFRNGPEAYPIADEKITASIESDGYDELNSDAVDVSQKIEQSRIETKESDLQVEKEALSEDMASVKKTEKAVVFKNNLSDEIESFDASCYDGNVVFNWVTLGKANHQFEIEKSYDNETYEVFTRAPQPVKEDGKNVYRVEEIIPANDVAFYRLRKKTGKSKYEYSDEVKVICAKSLSEVTSIDVFPNGYGSFRILVETKSTDTFTVTLYDMNNTELASDQFEAQVGNNEFVLNSSSISRGEYALKVTNGTITKEKKVVLK